MFYTQLRRCFGVQFQPIAWLAVILVVLPLGCSKEELKTAYNSAAAKTQELAAPVVEKIEDKLPESGNATLEMTPAVEMKQAEVAVIPLGDGQNVVQIVTYETGKSTRTYPCMMLHGQTSASSASTLSGQSVECDMYFQNSSSSPIAMTKPGSSVVVTFGQLDAENDTVTASLGMTRLIGSDGKDVLVSGGNVLAVVGGGGS